MRTLVESKLRFWPLEGDGLGWTWDSNPGQGRGLLEFYFTGERKHGQGPGL